MRDKKGLLLVICKECDSLSRGLYIFHLRNCSKAKKSKKKALLDVLPLDGFDEGEIKQL